MKTLFDFLNKQKGKEIFLHKKMTWKYLYQCFFF